MSRLPPSSKITFDMLRAFESLARSLNLSDTAAELGVTRQTVRRQIAALEDLKGGAFFDLVKQSYVLTPLGEVSLVGARSMLRQSDTWSLDCTASQDISQYLERTRFSNPDGTKFHCQQHPVSSVSINGNPLVQRCLTAWGKALARIECISLAEVRPLLAIYRRNAQGWVCVDIGEQSAYAKWFGWKWAKSAVGRLSEDDRAGSSFNRFIADAYERLHGEGGVRFDHLFAHLPRENSENPLPITFQRLLMGCVFPDGTPALAVLVVVTGNVEIASLSAEERAQVSGDLLKEFEH